jgi:hypothetical protein
MVHPVRGHLSIVNRSQSNVGKLLDRVGDILRPPQFKVFRRDEVSDPRPPLDLRHAFVETTQVQSGEWRPAGHNLPRQHPRHRAHVQANNRVGHRIELHLFRFESDPPDEKRQAVSRRERDNETSRVIRDISTPAIDLHVRITDRVSLSGRHRTTKHAIRRIGLGQRCLLGHKDEVAHDRSSAREHNRN